MAKRKKKEEAIYCVFCGTENKSTDENCKKCKKDLHPKNEPFKDFLYRHIKDDLKGKVEDNIFSYLKNYIISHLYGMTMTMSIIFTVVTVILVPKSSYKIVSSLNESNTSNSNSTEIIATIYTYDDSCTQDWPAELTDVPFPMVGYLVTGRRRTAVEMKFNKGESITDWCNNGNSENILCSDEVPLYVYDSKIEDQAKKYRDELYGYADWYHTNGIADDDEYMERADRVDTMAFELLYENNLVEYDKSKPINKSIDLFISEVGCEY